MQKQWQSKESKSGQGRMGSDVQYDIGGIACSHLYTRGSGACSPGKFRLWEASEVDLGLLIDSSVLPVFKVGKLKLPYLP